MPSAAAIPRPLRRGLIEAVEALVLFEDRHRPIPRPLRRGLIEASSASLRRGHRPPPIPRPLRRGLIEAMKARARSRRVALLFRGLCAAASLKPALENGWQGQLPVLFRGLCAAASLKQPVGQLRRVQRRSAIPRPLRRGLIEAIIHSAWAIIHSAYSAAFAPRPH